MQRVYHNFMRLEEYTAGMWRITRGTERKAFVKLAAELMIDTSKFHAAMVRAISEWPLSCAHNLCVEQMNRIAWLGHAGCCVGVRSPEDCTRAGWYWLTDDQMRAANAVAADALSLWRPESRQLALL